MLNKWVVLISGILIQIILGGVYAFSTFIPPLVENYSLKTSQASSFFGTSILVFTFTMILAGKIYIKKGPRFTAMISSLLYFIGYLLASFSGGNYYLILLGVGVIVGIALGFGYVCPLSVGVKWFPNHKGTVTGVAVAGFGAGAIIISYFIEYLLANNYNVMEIFRVKAFVAGSILFLSALLLAWPPEYKPVLSSVGEAYKNVFSKKFIINFIGIFAGTFSGLLIIGNLTPLTLHYGYSLERAVFAITVFSIGNASGRIIFGKIFDKYKVVTLKWLMIISLLSLSLLFFNFSYIYYVITILLVGFSFGGCFVVFAGNIVYSFGVDLFSLLYPICFLGYGFAGLLAPFLGGISLDITGSYQTSLFLALIILIIVTIYITKEFQNKKYWFKN